MTPMLYSFQLCINISSLLLTSGVRYKSVLFLCIITVSAAHEKTLLLILYCVRLS